MLYRAHLIVTLTTLNLLSFDNKKVKKTFFPFVLCSLIRNFAPTIILLCRRNNQIS